MLGIVDIVKVPVSRALIENYKTSVLILVKVLQMCSTGESNLKESNR